MPNWIIRAETTVMYEKVIEATSEADAWEKGKTLPECDFDCVGEFNHVVYDVEETDEDIE
jgi:hypothetical protein